jgi:hypothetical protein
MEYPFLHQFLVRPGIDGNADRENNNDESDTHEMEVIKWYDKRRKTPW